MAEIKGPRKLKIRPSLIMVAVTLLSFPVIGLLSLAVSVILGVFSGEDFSSSIAVENLLLFS